MLQDNSVAVKDCLPKDLTVGNSTRCVGELEGKNSNHHGPSALQSSMRCAQGINNLCNCFEKCRNKTAGIQNFEKESQDTNGRMESNLSSSALERHQR